MRSCFLIRPRVAIVYLYPTAGGKWDNYARRFVAKYKKFRPETEHRLLVVANGTKPTRICRETFSDLDPEWVLWDNSGWDIGAFQHVALTLNAELMVCLGASTYFRRKGWLERMIQSYQQNGMALYGAMGHTGVIQKLVWPHIRTTSFWLHPQMMNAYPFRVKSTGTRYEFEHGQTSISEWTKAEGMKRIVTAFDGDYDLMDANKIKNGYHKGNQSNTLCGDRLTEPPFYPIA